MSIVLPTTSKRIEARQKPDKTPVMYQNWRDLLFLHWEYDPVKIQKTLPDGLFVDTYKNRAFVGITPFFMLDVRPNYLPAVKAISNFSEVNVRTYVYDKYGNPGIYFYSLDADQPIAVELAKFIHLPYFHAEINSSREDGLGNVSFKIKRDDTPAGTESEFIYRFMGEEFFAESETLEFFLIERYILFSYDSENDQLYRGRVNHMAYPLFNTNVIKYDTKLLKLNGFEITAVSPDHIMGSTGVDVEVYNIEKIGKD
jgi:uncharacterized protein